jgi:PBP1b-binding outer membrane lipoprotein LpoB
VKEMKLKNILLIIGCLLLITGCSKMDDYLKKVSFLNKEKNQQENQISNQKPSMFITLV